MAQYFIGNFHNTIKFLNSSGVSLEGYENIDTFIQVLDLISKASFAPTIGFFYITTVCSDEFLEFSNNCFTSLILNRFMRSRNHLLLWTLAPVSPGAEEVYIVIYKLNNYTITYAALQAFLKNFPAISDCGIPDNSHTIPGYVLR